MSILLSHLKFWMPKNVTIDNFRDQVSKSWLFRPCTGLNPVMIKKFLQQLLYGSMIFLTITFGIDDDLTKYLKERE